MKILLDESLPNPLKREFWGSHEVWTVKDKGWNSFKNGELLNLITKEEFELFVTVDKNLSSQQNLKHIPFSICVFRAVNNRREELAKLVPKLLAVIESGKIPQIFEIS